MNNDDKILQALETLQADVKDVKQGQTRLEKDVSSVMMLRLREEHENSAEHALTYSSRLFS